MSTRIVFREYGSPKVLQVEQFEAGAPGAGELRVRNRAIGVNPIDWKVVAGYGKDRFPVEFPAVPGRAAAGVVEAIGEGVSGFAVGDEVIVAADGTFQDEIVVPAGRAVHKPVSIDFDQAAGLPVSATTGYALVEHVGVGADDTLLVHGSAGGVGAAAVQVAVARGATVIATASESNHEYLRQLGAIPVTYGEGLLDRVRQAGTVTAVVDAFGDADAVAVTTALLSDLSRATTAVRSEQAAAAGIEPVQHPADELQRVVELAEAGKLQVRIAEVLPLAQAAEAFERSYAGHAPGKIILHP